MVTKLKTNKLVVSTFEGAELLGVTPVTLRRLILTGVIPAIRLGPKLIKLRVADVEKAIGHLPNIRPWHKRPRTWGIGLKAN